MDRWSITFAAQELQSGKFVGTACWAITHGDQTEDRILSFDAEFDTAEEAIKHAEAELAKRWPG